MKNREGELARGIAAIWEKSLPYVRAQLDVLASAAEEVKQGTLSDEQRHTAEREAHRLAGSLGTFGFDEGTRAARALELMLAGSKPLDATKVTELVTALRNAIEL